MLRHCRQARQRQCMQICGQSQGCFGSWICECSTASWGDVQSLNGSREVNPLVSHKAIIIRRKAKVCKIRICLCQTLQPGKGFLPPHRSTAPGNLRKCQRAAKAPAQVRLDDCKTAMLQLLAELRLAGDQISGCHLSVTTMITPLSRLPSAAKLSCSYLSMSTARSSD